jgi:diguanylate cyclase (GGDEF)-like protein
VLDVPIALVSLVDTDRQWFKSHQGLDATETPRNISFCGHAILEDEVFVIEDATADPRFSDNPLVVDGPKIRAYAGCPVRGPGGYNIGTLCVIDQKPRSFDENQINILRDFAALVTNELVSYRLATTDELTGIANRRGFEMLATQALAMSERSGEPGTAVLIDLDDFKTINDLYGHEAGDEALIRFSELLSHNFRDGDVVGRLAGDEFCALLINADSELATLSISRLQRAVEISNDRADIPLSFSAGVGTIVPGKHRDLWDVMRDADKHMYQRKRAKKAVTLKVSN